VSSEVGNPSNTQAFEPAVLAANGQSLGATTATVHGAQLGRALLSTARPKQWAKNVLVFGAPATAGVLFHRDVIVPAVLAFVAFCLASIGVYFINDMVDAAVDRQHPVKRFRPVAAGSVSRRLAGSVGAVAILGGLAVAFGGGGWALTGVVAGYVALSLAYTYGLRNVALMDLAAIAGGFVLRAVAGGVATDVPLSSWFLVVASFGSLFLAAGKRHAEYVRLGEDRGNHRRSFSEYSEPYLRFIEYSAATVAITAYTQWAFEGEAGGTVWSGLSVVPFVLGIFRYGLLLEKGRGATPEDIVLTDRSLLVLGLVWVLLVAMGVYLT
jgi:decaprenyl-phosphate phosphoribosyltransferase